MGSGAAGLQGASLGAAMQPDSKGLRKAALMGATRTGMQIVAGFLSVKVTSVYLGPVGIGVLAQLQGLITATLGVIANGTNTGMVRLSTEYRDDPVRRRLLASTVARTLLAMGLPVALILIFAAPLIAAQLLGSAEHSFAVRVFGLCYVFGLFASIFTGLSNGAKDYASTTLMDVGRTVLALVLFTALSPLFGVAGGLMAAAVAPLATLAAAAFVSRGKSWWQGRLFEGGFSRAELGRLAGFIPMAACAVIGEPVAQIFVRDTLATHSGLGAVGLLQGVWRLSDLYVTVFTGVFSMYYLPRFVEVRTASELYREILRALGYIIPLVAAGSFLIYLLRDFLISLAYSREFMPMRDLFGWQMVGNVLKMTGWLFGYVLVARISPLKLCVLELAKGAAWAAFALWFIPRAGALGAVQSFVATYAVYVLIAAVSVVFVGRRMRRAEVMS